MNIAIIEDMTSDYRELKDILSSNNFLAKNNCTIDHYTNAEDFLSAYTHRKYKLIFVDIILEGKMSGLEMTRFIHKQSEEPPLIVFVTSERDFAVESYEVRALDYLLKPYTKERVDSIIDRLSDAGALKSFITVTSDRRQISFSLDDLVCASSRDHAVEIQLNNGTLKTYMSFEEFASMLPDASDFQICSRGVLVNLRYVDYIESGDFILNNGLRIPVSRTKRAKMQAAFNEYQIKLTRSAVEGLL